MNPPGVCGTTSLIPMAPPALEPPAPGRMRAWALALWQMSRQAWQHIAGRVWDASVLRAQPLEVAELSVHWARDLNLHASEDGWLEHQRASQRYEVTRAELPPRPFL